MPQWSKSHTRNDEGPERLLQYVPLQYKGFYEDIFKSQQEEEEEGGVSRETEESDPDDDFFEYWHFPPPPINPLKQHWPCGIDRCSYFISFSNLLTIMLLM